MANVTITTDIAGLLLHDIYFEMIVQDSATASYSASLHDIGTLTCEFDIPTSGEDVTAIGLKQAGIDVEVINILSDGTSLISVLENAFNFSNQEWVAKMYIRETGGAFGNEIPLVFGKTNINYDEVEETITFSFLPKKETTTTVADLVGKIYDLEFISGTPANSDAIAAGEFINDALEDAYPGTPVIDSDLTQGLPTSGDHWFVTKEIQASGGGNNNKLALYHVGIIATFEGAVFGSSYGGSFYVKRTSTANSVTLDSDNIEELNTDEFIEAQYRNIILEQVPVSVNENSYNLSAEKNINISFPTDSFYLATVGAEIPAPYFRDATQIATTDAVISAGIEGYKSAFGFNQNLIADVTYWGIKSIYPYSTITFDVDAPSIFQGKNFRIKKIDYNWKQDIAKMRIYEI